MKWEPTLVSRDDTGSRGCQVYTVLTSGRMQSRSSCIVVRTYLSSSHDVVIIPKKTVHILQRYMLEAEFKLCVSPDGGVSHSPILPSSSVSFSPYQALGGGCIALVSVSHERTSHREFPVCGVEVASKLSHGKRI